jgi:hypothetical protein
MPTKRSKQVPLDLLVHVPTAHASVISEFSKMYKSILLKGPAAFGGAILEAELVCLPVTSTTFNDANMNIEDDWYMEDDNASMGQVHNTAPDKADLVNVPVVMEQIYFAFYIANDDFQFLVSPTRAAATTACHVEVTLLKILTKLETPLWAFKVIMDWASNAAQSGYTFMPHQASYQSQLGTIACWVGMEQMHTIVEIPLPGLCAEDTIEVTTFDFISQFHSLLSHQELNVPAKLVVNQHDPFT